MKELLYLNKYFAKYRYRLIAGIIFVFAQNYFNVLIPRKIRDALDYVQGGLKEYKMVDASLQSGVAEKITEALLIFALTVIGLALLKGVMMYFTRQTIIVMSRLIEYDLRKEIYDHLQFLDLSYYKRSKTGDMMSRITEDVNKVRMYLGPSLLYGINLISLFTMTIYAMFQVSSTLTWYTLIPLPILSISIYYVSKRINKKSAIIQKQLGVLTSDAQEVYSGIRVVKSYVKERQFVKFFDDESEQYKEMSIGLAKINAMFFPLMLFLISMSTLIVVYVGGNQVASGEITAGNIAEFIIYVNMLTWPVTSIGWIASLIQQAEASQARISNLLREKPMINGSGEITSPLEGDISFCNVSFTYPDTGIKALDNISFDIHKGEKLAIIGKTASGKSSIVDLILRMYDASEGQIMMDGRDIQSYDLDHLRKNIGYVPQDVFLFSDTIAHNIRFGKPEASDDEIKQYAEYASIHNEIMDLPEGYSTLVGERGVSLSGGQKQRISIARAFIKDPDLVILDDSLSAVDTDTEQRILGFLNHVMKDKTAIIITHRVSGLLEFDKIIVMEDGRIAQQGTHDELIQQGGYYAEMIEKQSMISD